MFEWLHSVNLRATDAALLVFLLLVLLSVYRAHRNKKDFAEFNLFDLIVEGGRLSKLSVVYMGGVTVLTWMMVRLTLDGKMSEGFMTAYGAIVVGPVIAKLFSPAPLYQTTPIDAPPAQREAQAS